MPRQNKVLQNLPLPPAVFSDARRRVRVEYLSFCSKRRPDRGTVDGMTASRVLRFATAALLAVAGLVSAQPARSDDAPGARLTPEQGQELWQRMAPEQREQWLRAHTPEQRRQLWMRMSPEQRQAIRERMTPEQRDAMRQRWMQDRQRRTDDEGGPRIGDGMAHRLTPEQRQRLREQIREANRDWRGKGRGPRGER
jgi:hypothetical protein